MSLKQTWHNMIGAKPRKIGIIVGITVFLVLVYGGVSVKVWQDFQAETTRHYRTVQDRTRTVLSLSATNQLDKTKKREKIDDLYTTIKQEHDRCKINPLFFWLQNLPMNRAVFDKCEQQSRKIDRLEAALQKVTAHFKSEQTVAMIIASAAHGKTDLIESEWPGAVTHWAATETKVRSISEAATFTTTKNLAVSKLEAIQAAWQALIVANQAKDRAKYEESVKSLAQAYNTLNDISQSSEASLIFLVKELEQAYKALY